MPEVYVAAGSNVRPREHLRRALRMLRETWPALRVSTAYQNPAVGFEGEDFINLVVGFETSWPLPQILARLHAIEVACDRPRDAPKWAPRSMDLDVLTCGELVGEFPGAVLPRPDLLRKPYMLGPMAELAPELPHPTEGRSMRELWEAMGGDNTLRPVSLEQAE
ncbi:MAG: 2-amino-4-hydroxy-6-hydroxymethyldihydropteridine diphosphokinase [Steroidobacteraceae bacterium]